MSEVIEALRARSAPITFAGVTKEFHGGTVAVDALDLTVSAGEFMILVGPSGCGKTTALRMLAGLESPTAGEIVIGDQVVNDIGPRDRDIAMVFQNYALYPHMTVRGNLAFGLKQRKTPKPEIAKRVGEVAEMLGLQELLGRRPAQLSGGQRQRVAIAEALVSRPRLLILDEPLTAIDLRTQREIVALLARVRDEFDVTVLVVAHDLNPLLGILDSAIYLLDGHAHFDTMDSVVDADLLSHLYGTSVQVVHTPQGDLYMRGI
mgnify:CR=1 FL=1